MPNPIPEYNENYTPAWTVEPGRTLCYHNEPVIEISRIIPMGGGPLFNPHAADVLVREICRMLNTGELPDPRGLARACLDRDVLWPTTGARPTGVEP